MKTTLLLLSALTLSAGLAGCTTMRPNEISKAAWAKMTPTERERYIGKRNADARQLFDQHRDQAAAQLSNIERRTSYATP